MKGWSAAGMQEPVQDDFSRGRPKVEHVNVAANGILKGFRPLGWFPVLVFAFVSSAGW